MLDTMIENRSEPELDHDREPKGRDPIPAEPETLEQLSRTDDERLIREGEDAVERFNRSRDQILPMARGPLAASAQQPVMPVVGFLTWG